LAHVRRHDYAVNLLQGVIETLLFYHPAIWLLSSRIRTEREHCCDDEAVAITGKPTEYARALTRLASIGSAPHLATAATGGELSTRVRRLINRPTSTTNSPRLSGLIAILTLSLVLIGISSTSATDQEAEQRTDASAQAEEKEPPPHNRNPTWIIAKHAIIYEGTKVVDWDQVKETAKQLQKSGKRFHPEFLMTYGWLWDVEVAARSERYKELEKAVFALGPNFRTIGGLGIDRRGFDNVKVQSDLTPDPSRRVIGRVLTSDGVPASDAQIVLLPTPMEGSIQDVKIRGTRLAKPFQERFSTSNASGGFTAYPAPTDKSVAILHQSGFALTDTKSLADKAAIRLQKWVRIRGSIEGGSDEQILRLTAKVTDNLHFTNGLIADTHIARADEYPIVVPPSPVLQAERWIGRVGSIGTIPFKRWRTPPGTTVEIDMKAPTPEEIETGQQLGAARQREPQWFLKFDHSKPLETYAKQLDQFGIQLGAYFPKERRFVYLRKLSQDKPTARHIEATTNRLQSANTTDERRRADEALFDKANIDVSKATLFYWFPKPTLEQLRKTAADFSGHNHSNIKRCYFKVDPENEENPFTATRFTLEDWVKQKPEEPKQQAEEPEPNNAALLNQIKQEIDGATPVAGFNGADEGELIDFNWPKQNEPPNVQKMLPAKTRLKELREKLKAEQERLKAERESLQELIRRSEALGQVNELQEQHNRWFVRFGYKESQELYEKQLDYFEVSLSAYWPKTGKLVYLTEPANQAPEIRTVNIGKNSRFLYNAKSSRDRRPHDARIFAKAKLNIADAHVLYFYPPRTQAQLVALEQSFENKKPAFVQRTYFRVQEQGEGFRFVVTRQVTNKPNLQIKVRLTNQPEWIFAKHAIIFEGQQVVTWDHIRQSLVELAKRKANVNASFRFTRGANPQWKQMQEKLFKETENLPRSGVPFSVGFGGSESYDRVKIQADLLPNPELRLVGRAFQPDGSSAGNAHISIIPQLNVRRSPLIHMAGTALRVGHEFVHRWATASGEFVIYPEADSTIFVTHPSGYALLTPEQLRGKQYFRLKPWVTVRGKVLDSPGFKHTVGFDASPKAGLQFIYFDVPVTEDGHYEAKVPAGTVIAKRRLIYDDGTSISRRVTEWDLRPGETKAFDLKPMTDDEIEGFELDKKQWTARRAGEELSAEDQKRLHEK
jgi:hypothetical protein